MGGRKQDESAKGGDLRGRRDGSYRPLDGIETVVSYKIRMYVWTIASQGSHIDQDVRFRSVIILSQLDYDHI